MKYKVIMSGVPTGLKLGKIVQMISLMMSLPNRDFHVQLMPSEELMREVVVSFHTYSEAYLAQEMLDNFIYKEKSVTSIFKATLHKDNRQPSPKPNVRGPSMQPHDQEEGHQRGRSRSPHLPAASTELDMRIELLKKHKKVLEEKKKLLVEQKKLDILKMRSFKNKKKPKTVNTPNDPKMTSIKKACGVIMKTLTNFIYKYASVKEHNALKKHMRAIVMERVVVRVGAVNRGLFTTNRVMNMYRSSYPPAEDEEFVKAALQDVKKCLSSAPTATVSASPQGGDGNIVDGTEKAETAKDTTSPGNSNVSESTGKKATEKGQIKLEDKNSSIKTAIRVIMKNMRIYMIIHAPPNIRELLVEYAYFTIKQRIEPLVADITTCLPYKIITLYGSHYPRTKDEAFIKQLIKDINEGRVPEEIVIKAKQRKPFNKTSEEQLMIQTGSVKSGKHGQTGTKKDQDVTVSKRKGDSVESKKQISKSATEVVSNVKNEKNVNDVVIDKIEKGKDVSPNTKNEDNIKNKGEIKSQSTMENNSRIKDVSDETDKEKDSSANAKNACNEEMKSESTMEIRSDSKNAEKGNDNLRSDSHIIVKDHEIDKDNVNRNADRDNKMENVVKETSQKCSDNMEINKCNRGVKRKNDEEESDSIKHKADDIAVMSSKNTNKE